MKRIDQKSIDELCGLYEQRQDAIRERLKEFTRVPSSEYFYELIYCLMTPQSSAVHAESVVAVLRSQRFQEQGFDPETILRQKEHYIRFHRNKSKYLLQIWHDFDQIVDVLTNAYSGNELREWLVKNVKGLGYKEATHFLRNIGRNSGLAILDCHILRNLKRYGAIRTIPKTLSKKEYFRIERRFREFAHAISIPIDELDLLFWSMETGEIRK